MLHTEMSAVSPSNADYAGVKPFQVKGYSTLQPLGSGTGAQSYAIINPAASAYRKLFVQRIATAIQTLNPDAIHLNHYLAFNDGNWLIEGMNFNQGAAQLYRDLLSAFPNLVLGTETTSEAIAPYVSFAQPYLWNSQLSADTTPPVPISAYLFPNVRRYWHLFAPNANESGFLAALGQYEGQVVLPTFRRGPDYSSPDMARFMKVVSAFQNYGLQPAWDTDWNSAVVSYQGANGASATLTDNGTLLQFNLQQSGVPSVVYARAHATDRVDSSLQVANWPAYNGTLTLGLDPANQYWLGAPANNPALVHVTSLPPGVKLGLGTGTLVTPDFAYFQLSPSPKPFDFFANLGLANKGVTYNGADFPLANGADAYVAAAVVGGQSRQAINTNVSYTAQLGGESFIEYSMLVPVGTGANLSFATGILDTAIGLRTLGPMTFKVEVNGAILWQQDVSTGGWQAGSIDLSFLLGQTIKIRLVSNPGPSGSKYYAWGAWSALQLSVEYDAFNGITLAVSPALTSSNVAVTGGSVSVKSGVATVSGLPSGGTVLVFTGKPKPVIAGVTLLGIPPTAAYQPIAGQLASPAQECSSGAPDVGATGCSWFYQPADPLLVGKAVISSYPSPAILTWYLQLPASPKLALSFSALYYLGGSEPGPVGSVRVNGTVLWNYKLDRSSSNPLPWEYGTVDLSPWSGQTVVLELISEPRSNPYIVTNWAELTFGAASSANCAASLNPSSPISAPAAGATGMISVTTASTCNWSAAGEADWITATPSNAAGNRTVAYAIAANTGPARQSVLVIAGELITVTQAAGLVMPPVALPAAPFNFFANFPLADTGITYNGADFPVASNANARVFLSTVAVGGVSRLAIHTQEPAGDQIGGETFIEYSVPVPVGNSASLSFDTGIIDDAIGLRKAGPMTFKVEVNGAVLWQQDVSTGGWQAGSIDLSPFLGQIIKIRFVSNPGPSGSPFYGWGAWSALQLSVQRSPSGG